MRAVEFNLKDPAFGAELVTIDDPPLPNDDWARRQLFLRATIS